MKTYNSPFNTKTVSVSGCEMKPIYPQIWGRQNDTIQIIEFRTFLRKKHTDGKYYLQEFYKKYRFELNEPLKTKDRIIEILNQIHTEVYNNLIYGIINPALKTAIFDEPIFKLDSNQQEETERVKSYLEL